MEKKLLRHYIFPLDKNGIDEWDLVRLETGMPIRPLAISSYPNSYPNNWKSVRLIIVDTEADVGKNEYAFYIALCQVVQNTDAAYFKKEGWGKIVASYPQIPNTLPINRSQVQTIADCDGCCEIIGMMNRIKYRNWTDTFECMHDEEGYIQIYINTNINQLKQ